MVGCRMLVIIPGVEWLVFLLVTFIARLPAPRFSLFGFLFVLLLIIIVRVFFRFEACVQTGRVPRLNRFLSFSLLDSSSSLVLIGRLPARRRRSAKRARVEAEKARADVVGLYTLAGPLLWLPLHCGPEELDTCSEAEQKKSINSMRSIPIFVRACG